MQIPVCGNISHLTLPKRDLGFNLITAVNLCNGCQISLRKILKCSPNQEIRYLANLTETKNIRYDHVVNEAIDSSSNDANIKHWCNKIVKRTERGNTWTNFMGLKEQCIIIKFLIENCRASEISLWQDTVSKLTTNLFSFCRKSLIFCLSNASNLKRWGLHADGLCTLCKCVQTQFHVLSHCSNSLDRFTWRHDSVLYTISRHILSTLPDSFEFFVDLPELRLPSPALLFTNQRPDIVMKEGKRYIVIELTCPNEQRLLLSRDYKAEKYKHLRNQLVNDCEDFKLVLVEISTLGFMSSNIKSFIDILKELNCNSKRLLSKCCEVAIRCSFFIYCRRDKTWPNPEILNYV